MRFIEKISYWVDLILRTLIAAFLAMMTVVLVVQIVQRSIFQSGLIWADEFNDSYCFHWGGSRNKR